MTEKAEAFLNSLSPEQRAQTILPFEDHDRQSWNNLPAHSYARQGISLGALNDTQKMALHRLLQSGLSDQGYLKAQLIIRQDQQHRMDVFTEEGFETDRTMYGHDYYYITIFGTPGKEQRWSWRFEGHHLSMHFTITPTDIHVTPMFFGVDPREVKSGPYAGYSFMRTESEVAYRLINSLSPQQEDASRLPGRMPDDVLTQKGREPHVRKMYGLAYREMNLSQQEDLLRLVRAWVFNLDLTLARREMEAIRKAGTERLHFAWSGGKDPEAARYYRIQGPQCIIEYDNRTYEAWHIHSLWRNLEEDYGQGVEIGR